MNQQVERWLLPMKDHISWLTEPRLRIVCLWLSRFVAPSTRFIRGSMIECDSFGESYRATDTLTGKEVCLDFHPLRMESWDSISRFRKVLTLSENEHPVTPKLIALSFDATSDVPIQIVTEFFPNRTLQDVLKNERFGTSFALTATVKSKNIFGIVSGMCSLHARGILHRNLKPMNIFLNERFEPIIGGFVLSRPYDTDLEFTSSLGTVHFEAPEVIVGGSYDFSIDIYSFAVTLYYIFAEPTKWNDGGRINETGFPFQQKIVNGVRFEKPPEIPDYHWGVIERCWDQDPKERPTFESLLEEFHVRHEYILDGADESSVREYEDQVWYNYGPPNKYSFEAYNGSK
jgi:serine/threonine protein kinase